MHRDEISNGWKRREGWYKHTNIPVALKPSPFMGGRCATVQCRGYVQLGTTKSSMSIYNRWYRHEGFSLVILFYSVQTHMNPHPIHIQCPTNPHPIPIHYSMQLSIIGNSYAKSDALYALISYSNCPRLMSPSDNLMMSLLDMVIQKWHQSLLI